MQNIRLVIQYDGTRYLGWQRPEKDGFSRSVSYKINEVLNHMLFSAPEHALIPESTRWHRPSAFRQRLPWNPKNFSTGLTSIFPVILRSCRPKAFRSGSALI